MKQKPKRRRSFILRFVALGAAVYFIMSLLSLSDELVDAKAELAALEQEYNSKVLYNEELQQLLDSGSREEIIEKAARDRLGYVFDGETVFREDNYSGN
ncbi:MAG: septum formation initiator family protein [Clostridia bacterium]|nr:septum formation initiator family protein [Clostridia bacterium]